MQTGTFIYFTKNLSIFDADNNILVEESVKNNILSARSKIVNSNKDQTYKPDSTTKTLMKFNKITKSLTLTHQSLSEINVVMASCKKGWDDLK